jgi:aminocarboxymuconate-semialdehyde decarboxylase
MIYDCQSHWWPRSYFERLCERPTYPRAVRDGDGYRFEFSADRTVPFPVEFVDLDRHLEMLGEEIVPVSSLGGEALTFEAFEPDEAVEIAELINGERAAAQERLGPDRFVGVAVIPWEDTELALRVLDRAVGERGLKGVSLPSNIVGEPLDAPRLRPVYSRVAELGVPLFLHPNPSVMNAQLTDYGDALEYMVGYVADTSLAALRLVLSGIMEENPVLKVVHHHAGGVIPMIAGRIDKEVHDPWVLVPPLPRPPSEYFKRMYADVVVLDPLSIRHALDFYGIDHIVFGSDSPFWTVEESLAALDKVDLSEEERERVLRLNARDLLGID